MVVLDVALSCCHFKSAFADALLVPGLKYVVAGGSFELIRYGFDIGE